MIAVDAGGLFEQPLAHDVGPFGEKPPGKGRVFDRDLFFVAHLQEGFFPFRNQLFPEVDRAADTQPFLLALNSPFKDIDVSLGVKAMAPGCPGRLREAIASLPGAQGIRFETCFLDDGFQIEGWCFI